MEPGPWQSMLLGAAVDTGVDMMEVGGRLTVTMCGGLQMEQRTRKWGRLLHLLGRRMGFTFLRNLVGKIVLRIQFRCLCFLSLLLPIKIRYGYIIFILVILLSIFLK